MHFANELSNQGAPILPDFFLVFEKNLEKNSGIEIHDRVLTLIEGNKRRHSGFKEENILQKEKVLKKIEEKVEKFKEGICIIFYGAKS